MRCDAWCPYYDYRHQKCEVCGRERRYVDRCPMDGIKEEICAETSIKN